MPDGLATLDRGGAGAGRRARLFTQGLVADVHVQTATVEVALALCVTVAQLPEPQKEPHGHDCDEICRPGTGELVPELCFRHFINPC